MTEHENVPEKPRERKQKELPAAPVSSGYVTTDGNEALRYIQAGGRLVSIVRQFPKNPFKPGKRFTFLETKTQLDQLIAEQEEG